MGNSGDRYLWRPKKSGPIYVRFKFRLPGEPKPRTFVKSLGTKYYPEARRIRDRAFMPILMSLKCAETARDALRFVARAAEGVLERDLSLAVEGLDVGVLSGLLQAPEERALPVPSDGRASSAITWGDLSTAYKKHKKPRLAPPTVDKYFGQLTVIDDFIGMSTPLADVGRARAAALLSFLEEQGGREDTTINQYMAMVGRVFRFGRSRDLVQTNPAEGIRIEGATHAKQRGFTREEADAAAALDPPQTDMYPGYVFTAFSMFARYTGARLGEIAPVTAEDIVEKHGVQCITFRTEKTRSRGRRSHDPNETRFVPIPTIREERGDVDAVPELIQD